MLFEERERLNGDHVMPYTFDAGLFFDLVRKNPFPDRLTQVQVDGMTFLLRAWKAKYWPNTGDLRWIAYQMATTFHETAHTMLPVREFGSQKYLESKKYYPWIGRGFCQLTWRDNYRKAGNECGEDLLSYPDLALQPEIAAQIMHAGMVEGWFTNGKHTLPRYFNDTVDDPVNARRIINGVDRAKKIAGHHKAFLQALRASVHPIPA